MSDAEECFVGLYKTYYGDVQNLCNAYALMRITITSFPRAVPV